MTVAELHGKLSDTGSNVQDRLEDLITSNVFGPLRYLPDSRAVLAMLAEAERVDWSRQYLGDWEPVRNLCAETEAPQVQVRFWPMFDFSEPDILYVWALGDSRRFFLMVEVKYLSGPSDTDSKWVDEATPAVSLQLDREREDLRRLVRRHPQASGALVYLTGHNSRPRDVIPEPQCVGATSDGVSVYWTNWLNVYREVSKACELSGGGSRILYADIKALLERKGFAGMAPRDRVLSATDSWSLVEAAYPYKSAPVETQYSWQTQPLPSVALYSTDSPFSGMKTLYSWPESAGDTGGVGFYKGTDLESYDWRLSAEPHGYRYTVASKEFSVFYGSPEDDEARSTAPHVLCISVILCGSREPIEPLLVGQVFEPRSKSLVGA